MKRLFSISISLLLLLTLALPFAALATDPQPSGDARVTNASVNVRSGPGTSYALLDTLGKNVYVTVTGTVGIWSNVQYLQSKSGYILTDYLSSAEEQDGQTGGGALSNLPPTRLIIDNGDVNNTPDQVILPTYSFLHTDDVNDAFTAPQPQTQPQPQPQPQGSNSPQQSTPPHN